METIRSILVVVERSDDALHAFKKACALARQIGARIELFLCDSEQGYSLRHSYDQTNYAQATQALIDDARRYLEALKRSIEAPDLSISIDASCDTPLYQGIVRKVLLSCPDLVIKSIGSNHGGATLQPSFNDWHLVRTCPVPLLLTHRGVWRAEPRIAASIDLSKDETPGFAQQILDTASRLATELQGRVDLVFGRGAASPGATPTNGLAKALAELAREYHVAADHIHVLDGEPARALTQHVTRDRYDLVVLGALTHAEGPTDLVGTLTDQLMQAIDCDLLLLKPGTYMCPIRPPAVAEAAAKN